MTVTCGVDVVALSVGWVLGACTWLGVYLTMELFTRRRR